MLTKAEAQKLAEQELGIRERSIQSGDAMTLQINEQHIREFEYGWIFPYNSKQFIETGNIMFSLAGNGPLLVDKLTGKVWQTGSSHPIEYFVDLYLLEHYAEDLKWDIDRDVLQSFRKEVLQIIRQTYKCTMLEANTIFNNFPPQLTNTNARILTTLKYELKKAGIESVFAKKAP